MANIKAFLSKSFCVRTLLLSSILWFGLVSTSENKYSEDANLDVAELMTQIKPFRMQKVNLLWTTARKRKDLTEENRVDLFKQLQAHERLEKRVKKLKSENLDEDGLMEAKLLHNYRRIVEKYSLDDAPSESEVERKAAQEQKEAEKEAITFEDNKLQEMWKEAQHSGFSEEDLNLLQEEFSHQQMKIKEFNFVHGELNDLHDPDENTIFNDDDVEANDKDQDSDRRRGKLELQDGFRRLEHLATNLTPTDGEFEDPRVNSLWSMVQKSKWSQEKLKSFKEELRHFEKRLSKQKHFADQLALSRQSLEHKRSPDNHKFLMEKTDSLNNEIKKYHSHLKERVTKAIRHTEL
ncbi:alpha-2-macroglobulin receptor-associated protein [Aplysia californica]|uniref:Alpha-2-macroglobulin receptor-associated protein n=1 Tax=Aplysia californica TaxID=6500 RepID=A0ABM1AG07_APLCA|nr:alpha-2-macroglobulin receptor-associated protein [Aplysia californica]